MQDKESKFKQNIKKGLNQFFKCLSENAGKRKLTPIKIKILADFKDTDKQEKFPKEKDNGELKVVFDTLSKRKDFHKITAIGATVTYKGKDGKDDPKSFTLKSQTIDALAAAGEKKSKAEDKNKSAAKTKESKAETPKTKDETPKTKDEEPNAEDETPKTKDEEPNAEDETPKTKDEEPNPETTESAKGKTSEGAAAEGEKSAAKTTESEAEDKQSQAEDKKSQAEDKKSEAENKKSAASNKKESRRLLRSDAELLRATRRRLPVMAALLNPLHQLQCA